MDCRLQDRDELVQQYVTGQLSPEAQDEFEIHILECSSCLRDVEVLQSVRDDLAERAHEIRTLAPEPRRWFAWRWATALAVLVIVLGLGFNWYRHHGTVTIAQPKPPAPTTPVPPAEPTPQAPAPENQVAQVVVDHPQPKPKDNMVHAGVPKEHDVVLGKHAPQVEPQAPPPSPPAPPAPEENVVAQAPPEKPAPAKAPATEPANDEVAKEMFLLGDVQAPPYTFSGFAATNTSPTPTGRKGGEGAVSITPGSGNVAQGRVYFEQGMGAYVERNYNRATGLLEQAVDAEPNADDSNFYLGVCRLLVARPAEAIAPLSKVLTNSKSPFTQSAHFYLAKAYIQTADLAKAEEQLKAATEVSGRLSTQARALLARVQALRTTEQQPQP